MPDWYIKQPRLSPFLNEYISAFWELSGQRTAHASGSNPIQHSEIMAYFTIYRIDCIKERRLYVHFITQLDMIYTRYEQKQLEAERKKQEAKAKRGL